MGGIVNGMAAHGGLRPFGATFFCFSDYMRPSVRLSAIMRLPVVCVWTHDSIGLGEDGTTHQPVEHLASLRAMPHLRLIRPADANEAAQAWAAALDYAGPTGLVLSRQSLPVLDPDLVDVRGAVVADGDDATIVATGSEVEVALQARDLLAADGIGARVVSLPCWDLFRERPDDERVTILPPARPTDGRGRGRIPDGLARVRRRRGRHDHLRRLGQSGRPIRALRYHPAGGGRTRPRPAAQIAQHSQDHA